MAVPDNSVNIFIAYAHQDKPYLIEFRKHLSPLKKRGIIKLWDDAAILPGTEWDKKIKSQLEDSQIILLLVSPDFLNSDYIHQVELPKALARQTEGKATVIPIILRSCGWEYTEELSELQALPNEGRPVSNWANHDDAYYNILTGVKKIVDRIRAIRLARGLQFPHKDIPKAILYETFIREAYLLKTEKKWEMATSLFEKALPYFQDEFVPKLADVQREIENCRIAQAPPAPPKKKIDQPSFQAPDENRVAFNALILKGDKLIKQGQFEEAISAFNDALNLHQKGYSKSPEWLQKKIDYCKKQRDQTSAIQKEGLKRHFKGDLVGISTLKGKQVVAPIYEYIGGFRDGLALVKQNGRFGYINLQGDLVIPLQFEDGESFSEGLAKVIKSGKIGYINTSGKKVIKFEYEIADSFSGGLAAVVKNGKKMVLNKAGKAITGDHLEAVFSFSEEKQLRLLVKGGKKGIIDSSGKMLTKFEFDEVFDFTEGFSVVEKKGKRGYIDPSGKPLTPIEFETAVDFSEGFAAVGQNGQFSYINKEGKLLTNYQFDYAEGFSEGFALVGKNNKYGFINTKGEFITGLEFDSAVSFSQGLAAVGKQSKGGYINTSGKIVIPLIYETAKAFSGGRGQVVRDGKHGFVDKDGKEVIPCIYEGGTGFSEGLAGVLMNGKFGFIDIEGRVVIPFNDYAEIKWFSEGYAAVKKSGFLGFGNKWGYIDYSGKEVFPVVYSSAENFKGGKAKVVYKGKELTIEKLVI